MVIVGDVVHSRVARSNVNNLLSTLGAEVVLVAPPTLLPVGVETWPVTVAHDLDGQLPAADAVMMLRVQAERMNGGFFPSPREYSVRYGLNDDRLRLLGDDAVVLHRGRCFAVWRSATGCRRASGHGARAGAQRRARTDGGSAAAAGRRQRLATARPDEKVEA